MVRKEKCRKSYGHHCGLLSRQSVRQLRSLTEEIDRCGTVGLVERKIRTQTTVRRAPHGPVPVWHKRAYISSVCVCVFAPVSVNVGCSLPGRVEETTGRKGG